MILIQRFVGRPWTYLVAASLMLLGCQPPPGAEDGPCRSDATCNDGLNCNCSSNVCQQIEVGELDEAAKPRCEEQDCTVCDGGNGDRVLLLLDPAMVDPALDPEIRVGLNRFEDDLCADGYEVFESTQRFENPQDIRAYVAGLYESSSNLVGMIMVGDHPHAYQAWEVGAGTEVGISLQYYSDIDGDFAINEGAEGAEGSLENPYTSHTGAFEWEIWVGTLPLYQGNYCATADALVRYFDKNHAYRSRPSEPLHFMIVNEHHTPSEEATEELIITNLASGQYSWSPFSDAWNDDPESPAEAAYFYIGTDLERPLEIASGNSMDGYNAIADGQANFVITQVHGSEVINGLIDTAWLEEHPPRTPYFWSDGCSVADLDHEESFIEAVLYGEGSEVVVARGSTGDSGGMGSSVVSEEPVPVYSGKNIAKALVEGAGIGAAVQSHVNLPLAFPWSDSRSLHTAPNMILGDPTLGPLQQR